MAYNKRGTGEQAVKTYGKGWQKKFETISRFVRVILAQGPC